MIVTKLLTTEEDFETLKRGDIVACEFISNVHDHPKVPYRFNVFKIFKVLPRTKEIVWQKKNNIYSNYGIFLGSIDGQSNLKSAMLISKIDENIK